MRKWTDEEKSSIIHSYTNLGLTCKEIAKKYAAKPETISKYLKEWGIAIKGNRTVNRLLKEDYFSQIDTPQKAYFLGLLFADGAIAVAEKRNSSITLELTENDIDILNIFKQELNSNASLSYNKRKERTLGTYGLSIRSKQLADDLKKYNIIPNKTYLVEEIIIPNNYKIDYLRGYIDGDGSLYYSGNSWHLSITGHSKNIIQQIQQELNSLINKQNSNTITYYKNVYKTTWNGQEAIYLMQILYENSKISLTRKHAKAMAAQEDKRVEDIV